MLNTQKQPLSLLSSDLSDDLSSLETKIEPNSNPFANYLNNDVKTNPFHESNPFHTRNPFRDDENAEEETDSACSSLKVSDVVFNMILLRRFGEKFAVRHGESIMAMAYNDNVANT